MKRLFLTIILFVFSTSLVFADPIVGNWKADTKKNQQTLSTLSGGERMLYSFMLNNFSDIIFYDNGKCKFPKASMVGNWKKTADGYLLISNKEKTPVYISGNNLLIKGRDLPEMVFNRHASSTISASTNKQGENLIQYGRKYYRTTTNPDGGRPYIVVTKKECKLTAPDGDGHGSSAVSGGCSVMNGYLYMGPLAGKAKIVSSTTLKQGKYTYVVGQNTPQKIASRHLQQRHPVQKTTGKLTPRQLKAKRLAEWYAAHPDKRPKSR